MYLRGIILISSIFFLTHHSVSQTVRCYEDPLQKEAWQNEKMDQFLETVRHHEENQIIKPRSVRWFPVVVHVVARNIYQPISIAQVTEQIDILNNDFAGRGENLAKLSPEFKDLVANTEIQFCLATTDPDGNPTSGITYNITPYRDIALLIDPTSNRRAIHFDELGGKTGWDPAKYINIWVGEYGSYLGSAFLPGMAPYPEEIGVVVDIRAFGSLGEASLNRFYNKGHTLTHEMGHFFGLSHIWGGNTDTCDDSDDIDDTPNQLGPYYDCPSGRQMSCGSSDMYQNFMDFTDDRCLAAFTHGQAERMHASIDAYYPDLAGEGPCHAVVQPFQQWWDGLVWSYDPGSGKYVIYHPDGFAANIQIEVYSVDGRLVKRDTWINNQSYLLDLNVGGSGIYFVRMSDGKNTMIRKVVSL